MVSAWMASNMLLSYLIIKKCWLIWYASKQGKMVYLIKLEFLLWWRCVVKKKVSKMGAKTQCEMNDENGVSFQDGFINRKVK